MTLPICSSYVLIAAMRRVEESVAEAILAAPGWVRLGITAPAHHLRRDAAQELAKIIVDGIERQIDPAPVDQAALPL